MLPDKNITKAKWLGIRGRSFLAFAVLTVFTLLASNVGWVSYNRIEQELSRVVQVNMHSLQLMAELKEYGTSITVRAPTLLAAKDEKTQQQIWRDLNQNVEAMLSLLPQASDTTPDNLNQAAIAAHIKTLLEPLERLNQNISKQLDLDKAKQAFSEDLRWQAATFVSDIDSLIKNAQRKRPSRFDYNKQPRPPLLLDGSLEVLYRVKADFNLLASLIDRVQHLPDLSSFIATRIHSGEVVDSLNKDLTRLKRLTGYKGLRQSITDLMLLAQGSNNIFSIRRDERLNKEDGQLQLAKIRRDLNTLNTELSKQSRQAELAAQEAAQNVQATIKQGRIWAIFLVGGSLLFSILIVWLYIGHNIVGRITTLNTAMRSIAKGNLEQDVPVGGNDEIGAMARSLMSFRDQLSTLQEELVQSGKLAALGQLSAGISHEINQPLLAIRHYTHNSSRLIQMGRLKETEENLTHITLLTKRIISTITQLKSLAKGQQDNVVVVEVKQAVDNAMLMLSGHKILAETTLDIDKSIANTQVYADPVQLEQVIVNLVTNALDAVADNDEKRIQIICERQDDIVDIKVSDNGRGIAKELRGQVFDTFFTTKKRGQNLGLGLSISYNLVKNFGGKLSIDTEQEIGATFCLQLPRHTQGIHERSGQS
ncbi:two-component sensor histidine kinase [Leucothrix arctica]|uniref:histidine kinase n=2 Tax=Leucothrix arctica TaxID=1481894 RepID=A0A317CJC5_9GAMM|nr:two-component sensor histidine kinase [Leucothrix arctica]